MYFLRLNKKFCSIIVCDDIKHLFFTQGSGPFTKYFKYFISKLLNHFGD